MPKSVLSVTAKTESHEVTKHKKNIRTKPSYVDSNIDAETE
jgi:hypothetical protein